MASLQARIEKAEERVDYIKEKLLNTYGLILEEKLNKYKSHRNFTYKSNFGEVEITVDSRAAYVCIRKVIQYENEIFISKNEVINNVLKVLNDKLQIFDALMYRRMSEKARRVKSSPFVANMHIKIGFQKNAIDSYYITVSSLNNVLMVADIITGSSVFTMPVMFEFYIKEGKIHKSKDLETIREHICKGHGINVNTKNINYKELGEVTEMVEY